MEVPAAPSYFGSGSAMRGVTLVRERSDAVATVGARWRAEGAERIVAPVGEGKGLAPSGVSV